jgi:asparagine synthase (glutamine-hydrolysing)
LIFELKPDFRSAVQNLVHVTTNFVESLRHRNQYALFEFPQPWPAIDILITRLICETYLQENGVAQADRLSMASSVEVRLPLLDYRFVETVIGLRKTHADYRLPPKTWLKEAVKDLLPAWVLDRPKRGFEPPVQEWYQALFREYGSALQDGTLVQSGILTPEAGRTLSTGMQYPHEIAPLSFKPWFWNYGAGVQQIHRLKRAPVSTREFQRFLQQTGNLRECFLKSFSFRC